MLARLKILLFEAWPVTIISLAFCVVIINILNSSWHELFFYNTDSLILTQVFQSIEQGEYWHWIFSSQFNLFPATIIYFFAHIFGSTVNETLIINGWLNLAGLYIVVRYLLGLVWPKSEIITRQIAACSAIIFLMILMLLEQTVYDVHDPNLSIVNLFLFHTYFADMILLGIGIIALSLHALKSSSKRPINISLIVGLSIAGTISNPLMVVQFILPFAGSVILTHLFITKINIKDLGYIILPSVIGGLIGYFARLPLRGFMARQELSHIKIDNISYTINYLSNTLTQSAQNGFSLVGLLSLGLLFLFLARSAYRLFRSKKQEPAINKNFAVLQIFCLASAVWIIGFTIITGTSTTRYLLPIPIILSIYLAAQIVNILEGKFKLKTLPMKKLAYLSLPMIIILFFFIQHYIFPKANKPDSQIACVGSFIGNRNAVAPYWLAKKFDIHTSQSGRVLQVNRKDQVYPWIANLSAYEDKSFNYKIKSYKPSLFPPLSNGSFLSAKPELKPDQSKVKICGDVIVHYFKTGSAEYNNLNSNIESSLKKALTLSKEANMSDYFSSSR